MVIYKNLVDFSVSQTDSISNALKKIEKNKHKIVYVVDSKNYLLGALADGDFRRWSIDQDSIDMSQSINGVYNSNCFSMLYSSPTSEIEEQIKLKNRSIPLVDDLGHLIAVVEKGAKFYYINGRRISEEDSSYIIAEIGNNHQGDISLAKELVDLAVAAKVDCVKFQMRSMESLYGEANSKKRESQDLGAQYTLDLLSKYQLSDEEMFEIFDYCFDSGVTPICTPWDMLSFEKLERYGMPAYKIASADFTNYSLLEAVAESGKVMICSTGMSTEDEVRQTIDFLESRKAQYVLLHCNSTYPTPYKDINLKYISRLKSLSKGIVGYSGHERGWYIPLCAVALGAKVVEKHFTIDKDLEGNDHKVSLLPDEMNDMVEAIRNLESSLGEDIPRSMTQGEMLNREVLAKSLYVTRDLSAGTVISEDVLEIRSPGHGLQPNKIDDILGREVIRDVYAGECLYETDIMGSSEKRTYYKFSRPYGIPVRYHDYKKLTEGVKMDFVEFHLSYADMKLDVKNYVSFDEEMGFAVHSPELFENDHLLDLTSYDKEYLSRSITEMQSVVDHARELKHYFPRTKKPVVIVNVGGWSREGFLPIEDVKKKYSILKSSFKQVNFEGVEIAVQTMPPFPWHFGGQSYHNLFVHADEIADFCKDSNLKVCLDISHTMMACNYYKRNLYDFIEVVAPYVVHMHIVDAKGVDGEGIQIGHGDVDFNRLAMQLNKLLPNIQFIPEVWQGHKNRGEGFWKALDYLEKKFQ